MKQYDHTKIEKKWQKQWAKKKLYKTVEQKSVDTAKDKKCYVLDMFPYPSGEGLHVGHPKGYIATDVYSRFKRMQGFNVLHPMGFDAFGLPAENYAIKNKIHPSVAVQKNIKRYKEQLEIIGFDYDWSREVDTTDSEYYRWTQWIFLQLFKKGLAYESNEPINWCPSCKTGLANEDLEDGKCERCGSVVEKKPIRQWVLRITDYADRLLKDIDGLNWPESIKESQRNWIGRSEGSEISFTVEFENGGKPGSIPVFTTRADTLFGATALVLSPEHLWVTLATDENHKGVLKNSEEVRQYVALSKKKTEIERTDTGKEKTGVKLEGVWAVNPATKEKIPMYVADYVLPDYGTGAVMMVPAHDERDFQFAKKYGVPVKDVVRPVHGEIHDNEEVRKTISAVVQRKSDGKFLFVKWKEFGWVAPVIGGMDSDTPEQAAEREVFEETGYKTKAIRRLGSETEHHFYADNKKVWRARFDQPVYLELIDETAHLRTKEEEDRLELLWLSYEEALKQITHADNKIGLNRFVKDTTVVTDFGVLIDSGKFSGLISEEAKKKITEFVGGKMVVKYKLRDWVFSRQRYWGEPIPLIHCERCGVVAVPEKDLPVKLPDVKSYEPTGTGESPLAAISKWVNTKCPQCKGKAKRETNTMPQWAGSSWYYLRYMDPKNKKEVVDPKKEKQWSPVDLYVGGTEHATRHLIYARFWHKFLYDIGVVSTTEPFMQLKNQGLIMGEDGRKMSKRFGNVVNPDDVIATYGADTFRVYEMFMGPFEQGIAWSTQNMIGSRRFIERVWKLVTTSIDANLSRQKNGDSANLEVLFNKTVKKVGEDIQDFGFNTAISSLMILLNAMEKVLVSKEQVGVLLQLLAPFAPHMTEELWSALGNKNSIHIAPWPAFDSTKLVEEKVTVIVQINGKVRGQIVVVKDANEDVVKKEAQENAEVAKWLWGQQIKKIIYVPGRVVNIVI
ncbi:NUDIX domain-containing protein [Patescibacteria group bacterium]|nr:MAG: NUDIX domain-containing protein [Patescibacteria group bacterium]